MAKKPPVNVPIKGIRISKKMRAFLNYLYGRDRAASLDAFLHFKYGRDCGPSLKRSTRRMATTLYENGLVGRQTLKGREFQYWITARGEEYCRKQEAKIDRKLRKPTKKEKMVCENCGGVDFYHDPENGEVVCRHCGLVVGRETVMVPSVIRPVYPSEGINSSFIGKNLGTKYAKNLVGSRGKKISWQLQRQIEDYATRVLLEKLLDRVELPNDEWGRAVSDWLGRRARFELKRRKYTKIINEVEISRIVKYVLRHAKEKYPWLSQCIKEEVAA